MKFEMINVGSMVFYNLCSYSVNLMTFNFRALCLEFGVVSFNVCLMR